MDALNAEREASVTLALAFPTRGRSLGAALHRLGSASAVVREVERGDGPLRPQPAEWAHIRQQAAAQVAATENGGASVIPFGAPSYPRRLLHLTDPPPVLFAAGRLELLERPGVAMVGARNASEYGRAQAERLGGRLASAGATVISGFALGIDGSAHWGALEIGGDTLAVLGAGLDVDYPRRHRALRRRLLETGLLVTEFTPGTPPIGHHFPRRNRIVAALASAVLVVEAGSRSGSLNTVEHALDLGRSVFAVPGPIDSPRFSGSNQLLRDGAQVVVSPASLLEDLTSVMPCALLPPPSAPPASLEGPLAAVWSCLDGPSDADELSRASGLGVDTVASALTRLELAGHVVRRSGGRYARRD